MNKPITLTTDFSFQDPYIGAMKGAILSVNPNARITDIAHGLGAQDLLGAAFVLQNTCKYFPSGTIHIAIIDPGVGSRRESLIIETKNYIFIGPDNGVFSLALKSEQIIQSVRITNEEYFQNFVSRTFHGRDVFAPAAAHLSLGVEPLLMGEIIETLSELTLPTPVIDGTLITGEIIHIDGFGNLISNISAGKLEKSGEKTLIEICGKKIAGIVESYSESKSENSPCAIIGSAALLEIALNLGNAEESLNAKIGDKVTVSL